MNTKQNKTLRACGEMLAALESAKPNPSPNWKTEFVRSPKLRLGEYTAQLNSAGTLDENADLALSKAAGKIDIDVFSELPDTLTEEMQGVVWLGYYAAKQVAAEWSPAKLRAAFDASELSQIELAEAVGVAQGRVSEHLSGKTMPRSALRRKYENALGLEPGALG